MKIQYFTNFDDEKGYPAYKHIEIDISENATIKELFHKIQEVENIPLCREIEWNGNVQKIAPSYCISDGPESGTLTSLQDEELEKKISEFPKNGPNGELSLYLDNDTGLID